MHHAATFDAVRGPFVDTSLGAMCVWELVIGADALVLGSRQHLGEAGQRRAQAGGVEVVSRRSGGGAVYLRAATSLWVDLWFPASPGTGPADLSRLFVAVGEAWAHGLDALGFDAEVHRGPGSKDPARKRLAERVCFADVGWGEVTVAGVKVVGLSQRRVRAGSRVQCVAEFGGGGRGVLDFVDTTPQERAVVEARTGPVSAISARSSAAPLIDALLAL